MGGSKIEKTNIKYIRVTKDVLKELNSIKYGLGTKTLNNVIEMLLRVYNQQLKEIRDIKLKTEELLNKDKQASEPKEVKNGGGYY